MQASDSLTTYGAVAVVGGQLRKVWFQAASEPEARESCVRWNVGYQGPASPDIRSEPLPVFYDEKTARRLLGGISRSSLYRLLVLGHLDRVAGTHRLLITRSSVERYAQSRGMS